MHRLNRGERVTKNPASFLGMLFVLLVFFSVGCGYQFRATGEPLGVSIQSLAIPLITSTSSERGFEANFTRVIREEFISHGSIPLVSEEKAELLLVGRVYEIRTEPLSYRYQQQNIKGHETTYEETSKRRLRVRLDVSLVERASGKVIWQDKSMEAKEGYEVGGDPLANRYYQQQALERVAGRLAKRIYMKTMERF
jgi:hypothetical protein